MISQLNKATYDETLRYKWSYDLRSFSYEVTFSSLSSPFAFKILEFSCSINRSDCQEIKGINNHKDKQNYWHTGIDGKNQKREDEDK